ncbi:MAG: hypothetical protein WBP64_00355 [Nitrososphaeraceae archaeon]
MQLRERCFQYIGHEFVWRYLCCSGLCRNIGHYRRIRHRFGFKLSESKKKAAVSPKADNKFVLKYAIMLLAMAAGFVHLAVYAEQASLRIEYSSFLLVAGVCQFAYGMLYTLLTVTSRQTSIREAHFALTYYKKTLIMNLFGLTGTVSKQVYKAIELKL